MSVRFGMVTLYGSCLDVKAPILPVDNKTDRALAVHKVHQAHGVHEKLKLLNS